MTIRQQFVLMASYNQWMNVKLYEAAGKLSQHELQADRGAFFGSLLGTLNHIVVGDTIWLKRFATHPAAHAALDPIRQLPAPATLDQMLFTDFKLLACHRAQLDACVCAWAAALTSADLDHVLQYANSKGVVARKHFASLILHFFNHQTHHRGQASTLLQQAGIDIGVTDLLALIAQHDAA